MFVVVGYLLIFMLGYMLVKRFLSDSSFLETVTYSVLIGTVNVSVIMMTVGMIHIYLAIGVIAIEFLLLLPTLNDFDMKKINERISLSLQPIEVLTLGLTVFGLVLRMYLMQSEIPPLGCVDACKFYLPWAKQAFETGRMPLFDPTMQDIPTGITMPVVALFTWLYFWNGGINDILAYSVSPFLSVFTTIFIYLIISKIYDQKIGLVGAMLYALNPCIAQWDIFPYAESPMNFFTSAFIYFMLKEDLTLQSVAIVGGALVKFSGIALYPVFGYSYLKDIIKNRRIQFNPALIALIPVLWHVLNWILYGNPFPHLVAPMTIFEEEKVTTMTLLIATEAEGVNLMTPLRWAYRFVFTAGETITVNILQAFTVSFKPVFLSRLILLPVMLYSVLRRDKDSEVHGALFVFLAFNALAGVFDARYITPYSASPILASIKLVKWVIEKTSNPLLHPISVIFFLPLSALFYDAVFFSLLKGKPLHISWVVYMAMIVFWFVEQRIEVKIPKSMFLSLATAGLFLFPIAYADYDSVSRIESVMTEWNHFQIPLIKYIKNLPESDDFYLILENPFPHYYADINNIELADPTNTWMVDPIFDLEGDEGFYVFFGSNHRRLKTQEPVVGRTDKYTWGDHIYFATITGNLPPDEYYIIIEHVGLRKINVNETYERFEKYTPRSMILFEDNKTRMELFNYFEPTELISTRVLNMSGEFRIVAEDVWLKQIIIVPTNSVTWERMISHYHALRSRQIKYILYSHAPSHIWSYEYSSLYFGLLTGVCESHFKPVWTNGHWTLYELVKNV